MNIDENHFSTMELTLPAPTRWGCRLLLVGGEVVATVRCGC
jgi:hypothetical protein